MTMLQKSHDKTRKLVSAGMLSAISIILGMTPLGIIPIGPLSATTMHLPVIIGAVLEGPVVSLYQAASGGSVLAPLFMNPLVSILPRLLIGPCAYFVFRGVQKLTKKRALSAGCAAVVGTLTNTVGVMGFIYILYAQQYAAAMGLDPATVGAAILSASALNGIPECAVAVIVTVGVTAAVWHMRGKGKAVSAVLRHYGFSKGRKIIPERNESSA